MTTDRYLEEFPGESGGDPVLGTKPGTSGASTGEEVKENRLMLFWESLFRAGLGETVSRIGTNLLLVALALVVIWGMRAFYLYVRKGPDPAKTVSAVLAGPLPTATPTQILPALPPLTDTLMLFDDGIPRLAMLHTTIPTRPRTEIITYTVKKGDTIFGIAEMFNLKPETILWGNRNTLSDDPHNMQPDIKLIILPGDGVYHEWSAGEGLNGVSSFYGVTPEDIINWPGNHLKAETIGDYAHPNIEPGTMLYVPGGARGFVTWSAPLGLTRQNPGVARILGPGFCGTIVDGAVGIGSFIWPSDNHWRSGYDYSPATNHRGLDIGGHLGDPIYAADHGVIVYAGWNNYGYGNVVVIDHGNGWQTLYAHMSAVNVGCGQSVYQGEVIGWFGSTGNSSGPHLHFEIMNASAKVNPWDFLPAP
jgi:hypothetical protein